MLFPKAYQHKNLHYKADEAELIEVTNEMMELINSVSSYKSKIYQNNPISRDTWKRSVINEDKVDWEEKVEASNHLSSWFAKNCWVAEEKD